MKCGSFNKLVGVDSECDSWVLETIHGVASGSATIVMYGLSKPVTTKAVSLMSLNPYGLRSKEGLVYKFKIG